MSYLISLRFAISMSQCSITRLRTLGLLLGCRNNDADDVMPRFTSTPVRADASSSNPPELDDEEVEVCKLCPLDLTDLSILLNRTSPET